MGRSTLQMAGALLALASAAVGAQGVSGRITGEVTDGAIGVLAGVEVRVLGADRSATTDARGGFALERIPVGSYTVRFSAPGRRAVEYRDVEVPGGGAVRLDAVMAAGAAGEPAVVKQAGPVGDPGDPILRYTVPSAWIAELPADRLDEVLAVLPGVSQSDLFRYPSVRGTHPGEAVTLLNGVPVRSLRTGRFPLEPALTLLAEASLIPVAGSGFGDAHGGLVNLVTRSGGSTLAADVRYATDVLSGSGTSIGLNRVEGSVGGPIGEVLRFYFGGSLQGQLGVPRPSGASDVPAYVLAGLDTVVTPYSGGPDVVIPRFAQFNGACDASENYGVRCQGRRFPLESATYGNALGRIDLAYGGGSITFTAMLDMAQGRGWPGSLSFDPQAYQGTRTTAGVYALRWTHDLLRAGERYLALEASTSYQTDSRMSGSLDPGWEVSHRSPAGGILLSPMRFLVDRARFSSDTGAYAIRQLETDAEWARLTENFWFDHGTRVPFLGRSDLRARGVPRVNPWGSATGFPLGGPAPAYANTELANERRRWARLVVHWRPSDHHDVRVGSEVQGADVEYFEGDLVSLANAQTFAVAPSRVAAFASDRIDHGPFALDLGLRWERFRTGARYPVTPGRIFTHPAFDSSDPASLDSIMAESETHTAVLPRAALGVRLWGGTGVRLSYTREAAMPNLADGLENVNDDLANTSANTAFGRDVGFVESTLMEAGLVQRIGGRVQLDLTGYWRKYHSGIVSRIVPIFDPFADRVNNLPVLTNADTGSVYGVEVAAQVKGARWMAGQLSYTYQDAGDVSAGSETSAHTIAAFLVFTVPGDVGAGRWYGTVVGGLEATAAFRAASGLRYTRLRNYGLGILAPLGNILAGDLVEPLDASSLPWTHHLDLRVTKAFRVAAARLRAFLDLRNALNTANVQQVYAETGETTNDRYQEQVLTSELATFQSDAYASGAWIEISKDGRTVGAVDLGIDCAGWAGGGGTAACVALRRAEVRWGNADGIYDVEEFTTAIDALYGLFAGEWTLFGPGRQVRVGVEVRF